MLGASLPQDPDYSTPWRPARVRVDRGLDDVITVDLGSAAFANTSVGSELAAVAVQQLVYTVTAALDNNLAVRVLVDGRAGYDAWGAVRLGDPMRRDPSVVSSAWVVEPQHGDGRSAGQVTVKGFGHGFEGAMEWRITDGAGALVRQGTAQGGANGRSRAFEFPVTLRPGTYTITLSGSDPSDGGGPGPDTDTKTFSVR
jgi:hypothetical protein